MAMLSFTRQKPVHFTHMVSKMAFYVWRKLVLASLHRIQMKETSQKTPVYLLKYYFKDRIGIPY